jgi:hypothetical protein
MSAAFGRRATGRSRRTRARPSTRAPAAEPSRARGCPRATRRPPGRSARLGRSVFRIRRVSPSRLAPNLRDRPVLGGERAAFDERVDLVAPINRRRRQHVPVNERLRANKRKAPPRACARARARVAQTCDWGQVGPSHADGSTSRAFTGGLRLSPSGPTGRVGCLTTSVNDSAASSCAWNASTSAAVGVSCEKNHAIRCAGGAWARRAPSHTAARRRLLHRF